MTNIVVCHCRADFIPSLKDFQPSFQKISAMKNINPRSLLFSIILSATTVVTVAMMIRAFRILIPLVLPNHAYFNVWKVLCLIGFGIIIGLLAENYSIKRMFSFILPFLTIWLVLSILAMTAWNMSLMFIPVFFTVLTTTFVVHVKKMWLIDSELTEKLVSLASAGHILEGKSAELRIESGLKLLETILPLSEAIVFHFDNHGELVPVGRARNNSGSFPAVPDNASLASRQTAWRESVQLCEEALQWRQTMILTDKNQNDSAQVAIPLIYEETVVGVLYVKVRHNFERGDQQLLEAFCGQLARNFQRKELRQKDLPQQIVVEFLLDAIGGKPPRHDQPHQQRNEGTELQRGRQLLPERSARDCVSGRNAGLSEPPNAPHGEAQRRAYLRDGLVRIARPFQHRHFQRAAIGDSARAANRRELSRRAVLSRKKTARSTCRFRSSKFRRTINRFTKPTSR